MKSFPSQLNRLLMTLPARQRLGVLLQRPDAEEVVSAMAEEDFYFSVKEIGPDDALPLLSLARVEQLNFLFDLEWWQKDTVLPAKAVDWLERLARASDEKLAAWLYQADFELLVTLFKKWMDVSIAPEDIDPLEARDQLPMHTLDDQFFWEVHYPQYEDFLKRLLSLLFEVHYGFYRELMNHVVGVSGPEIEEEAYRFHRARLEDLAIPDYYEALEIYRFIRPEEPFPMKNAVELSTLHPSAPAFALSLLPEQDLLARSIRESRDESLLDSLRLELAALSNKVVVADQLSPDNPGALHHAVDKAAAYVNLGLQLKSAGDLKTAQRVLRDAYLEHLFRLGHAQVANLRGRLQRIKESGWLSHWPGGVKCLDSEWFLAAELLLKKTPYLLRPASESQTAPREDLFRSEQDLARGKHLVDVIASVGPLFETLRVDPLSLDTRLWQHGQIVSLDEVTLGAMIWTAAAWFQIAGTWDAGPLPVRRWSEIFGLLQPKALEKLIRSWASEVLRDSAQFSLSEAYLNPIFQAYAQEIMPFLDRDPPDPRLVRFFLFTED